LKNFLILCLGNKRKKQKYRAIRNRGYTDKACLRRLDLDVLVRAGGLGLCSPKLPVCGMRKIYIFGILPQKEII
jgi:hypothetical protein